MEVASKTLEPTSLQREFIFQQARCEDMNVANNVVVGEDFSMDDLLDFSNGEFQQGFVGNEIDDYEEEEKEEEKDSTSGSSQSQDRTEDDSNSNSTDFSGAGDSESIFAGELAIPDDDLADLEWVSHFVDDSLPELSLSYLVPSEQPWDWPEPKPKSGSAKPSSLSSKIPVKPRTNKTRKPNCRVWSFNPMLLRSSSPSSCSSVFSSTVPPLVFASEPPAKKQKKKPRAQTGGPQFQRRCSHCQVQKTPQWRAGPLGPKTLCNACGVRFKSGRLFPEYRPAYSPTFSGDIHSNNHRKVLEIRRRKEAAGSTSGLDRVQMVPSC